MEPALNELVEGPLENLSQEIVKLTNPLSDENLATLAKLLTFRAGGTYNKHAVPYLVCLGILRYGTRGIRTLVAALQTAPGAIYPTTILAALFYAADGQLSPAKLTPSPPPYELTQELHAETIREAKSAVADVVQESFLNSELFDRVLSFFYQNQLLSAVDAPEEPAADGAALGSSRRASGESCDFGEPRPGVPLSS